MTDSNSDIERWKNKYLETLEELEKKEGVWRQTDESLRRGLSRLALVSTGLDSGLDTQLKNLRRALHDQVASNYLDEIVDKISNYLKTLDERGSSEAVARESDSTLELLDRMISMIEFPESFQIPASRLQRALKDKKIEDRLDQWVTEFSQIVAASFYSNTPGEAAKNNVVEKKAGWWKRLFSEAEDQPATETDSPNVDLSQADRSDIASINLRQEQQPQPHSGENQLVESGADPMRLEKALLEFLEHLVFPSQFSDRVRLVRDQLVTGLSAEGVTHVIKSLVELVTDTQRQLEQEKEELEQFLRQLGERLEELDSMVEGAENDSLMSLRSGFELDEMVKAQVNDIEQTVQSVNDVNQMKDLIQGSIEHIRTHLEEKHQQEVHHQEDLQQQLKKLNERLHQLEDESERLRMRLAEERAQAMIDPLTNVPNRLGYEHRVIQECARWERYGNPLSLLVCDIDNFKRINDSFGHKAGDRALVAIAKAIEHHTRSADYLARIGGEEFVVLLPETTLEEARVVAEKLRKGVELCDFVYNGNPVPVTISGGIAEFSKGDKSDDVYERADKALYNAKKAGRNQFKALVK